LHLALASSNHVVNLASDTFDLGFAVKSSSHLLVSLNEAFQLLLETVVLVVEVCHVLVQGIDFGLEFDLVPVHLVGVLAKSVDFVGHALFVLF
jgi:hypothetical protein